MIICACAMTVAYMKIYGDGKLFFGKFLKPLDNADKQSIINT